MLARAVAVLTENIHWDEFAILHRAALTLQTGNLHTGGRPGLGTLVLLPFAAGCRNALDAVIGARVLWTGMVIASGIAFWMLLRSVLQPSMYRRTALITGLALWMMAPPFLRFSVQVRTDQPAIMFGLLGGLALVASRRRSGWAAVAGLLFGVGFLFSQKLLYVAGLVGVLSFGDLMIRGEWRSRREAVRACLVAVTFLLVVAGYREAMQLFAGRAPALVRLGASFDVFDYYRETHGWRYYRALAPTLLPQVLMLVGLLVTTLDWLRSRGRHGRELAVAWMVILTGATVLLFHAARFPYFYMVLGLFPAAVGALTIGPMLERIRGLAVRRAVLGLLWTMIGVLGLARALEITRDTQLVQRESLSFVDRNFAPSARGFHTHGAFVCRGDPDPFPVRFNQNVVTEFGGEQGTENGRAMIADFRERPVTFMIHPNNPGYPPELQLFWATRYVLYRAAVHVPGRLVRGPAGSSGTFEVIVPGQYVWRPSSANVPLEVAGRVLQPGGVVPLGSRGVYPIALPQGGEGMLVLRLQDPPLPYPGSFYLGW